LELARAAGKDGMCAGQVLDLEGETRPLDLEELTLVHRKKTGALLEASCVIGVLCADGTEAQLAAARAYAAEIGLAFQVRDDLLDCTSTTEELGKPVGSDAENHKSTFVTLLGEEGCRRVILDCTRRAKDAVSGAFPDAAYLCDMADWLAGRNN
ncbi:MAG: polyprenyl synthetase family protein, partial [Oscillospiraceae bacterium]|nr:polyprenyl synthetase family protein [Oscillospiraceae bacterium]